MVNLWSLKTILRCFELTSGLKVNFSKSLVMGVNVGEEFLDLAERFLYCRVGSVPFTYLGLPVGANPRIEKTWQPLLQLLSNRPGSWGYKYVNLGGRVVLLNSVLNAIPIFDLFVMKMHVKVWKKIVRLQREFLWGGVKRSRSIPWISWAVVWDGGLWRDILSACYGTCYPSPHLGGRPSGLRGVSSWWSNISLLGSDKEATKDWFSDGVAMVMDGKVGDLGHWEGEVWVWDLSWRRPLFIWELDLLADLLVVATRRSRVVRDDEWSWNISLDGRYSMKSAYSHLIKALPAAGSP
ncbi:hypothetical protein MTR_2g029410 [Medicago truncatula]|uniref:Uncharacterized protein n=1 Tax=Medicago truncatula TaxID=3880 RepID=A0A072VFT7_MEDTR|nr:hypothetical protein MTR_2g029410 [Medicago truncatula]